MKQTGRFILEDVTVTGFDDVDFAGYISPPLTTIRAPVGEVGRETVRQPVKRLNGQPTQPLTLTLTPASVTQPLNTIPLRVITSLPPRIDG